MYLILLQYIILSMAASNSIQMLYLIDCVNENNLSHVKHNDVEK